MQRDVEFMRLALEEAQKAAQIGEIPVGAVWVLGEEVVAQAGNSRETAQDPLGHAEIRVLRMASEKLGRWRLGGTLYVTLEPCVMCAGALVQARVDRVVYGTHDHKAGAVKSLYEILGDPRLNHRAEVISGVLEEECSLLLKNFFKGLRDRNRGEKRLP